MDYLLDHLESAKTINTTGSTSTHLVSWIKLACNKPNKYYGLTETNSILYAAVALHPSMKFDSFEDNWPEHPEWIEDARSKVKELWETK